MALVPKQFNEVINFTRGTGATRINAAGLIVGVDFSSTSNTITTGSKTFTLTADANVNRDWPVGSSVRAVDQVGGGAMIGTVTSYTPSTQALVIEVTSITGSGTSTNWRIGSLEVRRDSNGVLVEGQGSNLLTFSEQFENATWQKQMVTITSNTTLSPDGSIDADSIVEPGGSANPHVFQQIGVSSGVRYTFSVFVKQRGTREYAMINFEGTAAPALPGISVKFSDGTVIGNGNQSVESFVVTPYPNGYFYVSITYTTTASGSLLPSIRPSQTGLFANRTFTTDSNNGLIVWGAQLEASPAPTSYIPTTTVGVTRAADSLTATATTLAALRQGEGTLIVTAQNPDNGIAQKRALRLTGANGEIRIGKQGVGTTANFTKMAEGAGVRLMGTANSLISNNGLESAGAASTFAENNTLTVLGQTNAVTFNGTDTFGRIGSTEESILNSALTTRRMLGLGGTQINGAHWTGTSFIAGTAVAGRVLKSNGTGYRAISSPSITRPTNEVTSGLVGGTNRVVIVGNNGFIATSDDDGETWTARTSGTINNLLGATFGSLSGSSLYLVSGVGGQIRRSTDGITYTNGTGITAGNSYYDVHIANNIAVAVSDAGQVLTSTNGSAFTAATATNTTATLLGVTYSLSLNLWIAVGSGGTIITATDPTGTWAVQTSGTTQTLQEVGVFNNAIYVVGNTQTLLTSTNGTTYTPLTAGVTATLIGIAASPTTLLITGSGGAMASSTDGTTFTSRTNNNATLNGIAFGAGRFVSVGNAANGSGYIATIDADGTVTRRVSGRVTSYLNSKFVGGKFYALGSGGGDSVSADSGATWSNIVVDANYNSHDIAANGAIYIIAAGNNAGTLVSFRRSVDAGVTWAHIIIGGVASNGQLFGVDFANNTFVLVGGGGRIYTLDSAGQNPILRTSGTTQNLNSVMYSQRDSRWYAAGNAGTLLFSEDNGVTWQSVQNAGVGAVTNNGLQANLLTNAWVSGSNKIAISYKENQVITSINGASKIDTMATAPTFTALTVGDNFNGYITKIEAMNDALSATQLNQLTGP